MELFIQYIMALITVVLLTISVIIISKVNNKFIFYLIFCLVISVIGYYLNIVIGLFPKFSTYAEPASGVFIIISMILMLYKSGIKFGMSIVYMMLTMFISVITDTFLGYIISAFFEDGTIILNNIRDNFTQYLVYSAVISILIISFSKLISVIFHKNKIENKLSNYKLFNIFLPISIITTFAFVYASAFIIKGFDNVLLVLGMYIVFFLLIIVITYILFSSSSKEAKARAKQLELEQLTQYTDSLELMHNDMRKFKHDYINILASMTGYMESNDMPMLKEYFNDNILSFSNKIENDFRLDLLSHLTQVEIKGIVSYKLMQAQD